MKLLVNGKWHSDFPTRDYQNRPVASAATRKAAGTLRPEMRGIEIEPQNCHLYVSYACPFAHRVIITRALLGLGDMIGMSVLGPDWSGPEGWVFSKGPDCTGDLVNGKRALHQVYTVADPHFSGKVTVPVLWASREQRLVSTESLEIVRIMTSALRNFHRSGPDLCPQHLETQVDEMNAFIDGQISSGVYRTSPTTDPDRHADNVARVFDALLEIDHRLQGRSHLLGDGMTEADIVLFTTMIRFDVVYHDLFGYDRKRLAQLPNIAAHTSRLGSQPAIASTVKFNHIIRHYYTIPEFAGVSGALRSRDSNGLLRD
ncbi:MAG TPA: glutathione S-transferase C-terminal domain-containing protein [bacterium]|nr:glutathione S-transferase C-terminal domain-containing protein [bacterium]